MFLGENFFEKKFSPNLFQKALNWISMNQVLQNCTICPRKCGIDRTKSAGYCGASDQIEVSKVMLHRWEEPCISGTDESRGSGAVFFTHCPLGCVYCQNRDISRRSCAGRSAVRHRRHPDIRRRGICAPRGRRGTAHRRQRQKR